MSEELKVTMIEAIKNYLNSCEEEDQTINPLCTVQRTIEIRIKTNIETRGKKQREEKEEGDDKEKKKRTYLDDDENLYD